MAFLRRACPSLRSLLAPLCFLPLVPLALALALLAASAFLSLHRPLPALALPVWLQYGEHRVPHALLNLASSAPLIAPGQPYDVSLRLSVPANDRNLRLGNFMVKLSLLSPPPNNFTLHTASRPASLLYEPPLARLLQALKHLLPLFFLSSPTHQQLLRVPLLERRVLQPRHPAKSSRLGFAHLDVGRQDAYHPPHPFSAHPGWGELQTYEASLVFDAHLHGLSWLLHYHPYLSFAIFTSLFFTTEFLAVFFVWATVVYRSSGHQPRTEATFQGKLDEDLRTRSSSEVQDSEETLPPDTWGTTTPLDQPSESGSADQVNTPPIIKSESVDDVDDGVLLKKSQTMASGRSASHQSQSLTFRSPSTFQGSNAVDDDL